MSKVGTCEICGSRSSIMIGCYAQCWRNKEMTNKTERYFVVGESELRLLVARAMKYGRDGSRTYEANLEYAEAACRVREVQTFSDTPSRASVKEIWVETNR